MPYKSRSQSPFEHLPSDLQHDPRILHSIVMHHSDLHQDHHDRLTVLEDQAETDPIKYLLKKIPWPVLAFGMGIFASLRPKEAEGLILKLLGLG